MTFSFREWILISAVFVLLAGWGVDRRIMISRFASQATQISLLREKFAEYERAAEYQKDHGLFREFFWDAELNFPVLVPEDKHTLKP